MKSRFALLSALLFLLAISATAKAESINYIIDTDASSASMTIEYGGVIIGSASLDVTGSYITFDAVAGSLTDIEVMGSSESTILLSETLDLGIGLVSEVDVISATLVDAGAFNTITFLPGQTYSAVGPIDVTSSLVTNLGPTAFDFSSSLAAAPINITDNGGILSMNLNGFSFATFDVYGGYDELGNAIVIGQATLKLDMTIIAAPVPEPSAAVLYLLSFVVATPFFKRG